MNPIDPRSKIMKRPKKTGPVNFDTYNPKMANGLTVVCKPRATRESIQNLNFLVMLPEYVLMNSIEKVRTRLIFYGDRLADIVFLFF